MFIFNSIHLEKLHKNRKFKIIAKIFNLFFHSCLPYCNRNLLFVITQTKDDAGCGREDETGDDDMQKLKLN